MSIKTKRKKIKSSDYYLIADNEIGIPVFFKLPLTALYYDTNKITLSQQDKIDDTKDALCDLLFYREDEALIFEEMDKATISERVKKTGRWI